MEVADSQTDSVRQDTSHTDEEATSFTREELLNGKTKIPLGAVFPFLFNYINDNLEKTLGVSSKMDQNFLMLQQMITRDRISKIEGYQCLQPLLVSQSDQELRQRHPTVASLQKYDHILQADNSVEKKPCYILYYLKPITTCEKIDLTGLHELYQNEVRPKLATGFDFSCILKPIHQCFKSNHFHFAITEKNNENIWVFIYSDKYLFIYKLANIPPRPHVEPQAICRWISIDTPIYERQVVNTWYLPFTEIEMASIMQDEQASIPEEADGEQDDN
jgi:hypothetical protein